MKIPQIPIVIILLISVCCNVYAKKTEWNVFDFGALGNGITLDTQAIQTAIDECHKAGGGKVCLSNGCFLSGTLYMKDNVELHIETGAKLLGSRHAKDYESIPSSENSITAQSYNSGKALIYGENLTDIAITGNGIIDGNGDKLILEQKTRAHLLHFKSCNYVKVKDITLRNGSWWIQKYHLCNHVLINGVTVYSKENQNMNRPRYADTPGRNTDGCNIVDSKNVQISDCNIFSGDDGIVFKSFSQTESCNNITVNNCIISTNASGIKIGTETAGAFHDILINNCIVYDTRLGGIELMAVDGAKVERVTVSNISMNNVQGAAIFIRLANRARKYDNQTDAPLGLLKNILISNVTGTSIGRYGCSLTGIPQAQLENIALDNINLTFTGGSGPLYFEGYPDKPVKELTINNVPEQEKEYPRCDIFGKLPAYGFYIRHAKNIKLKDVRLAFEKEEKRPAIIADDVTLITVRDLQAQGNGQIPSLIHLHNVKTGFITDCICTDNIPSFLRLSGKSTKDIQTRDNFLRESTKEIIKEQ